MRFKLTIKPRATAASTCTLAAMPDLQLTAARQQASTASKACFMSIPMSEQDMESDEGKKAETACLIKTI